MPRLRVVAVRSGWNRWRAGVYRGDGITAARRERMSIAFWADNIHEVDRLAAIAVQAGARNVEGPTYEDAHYYAVFFEDPGGNRLEICYRKSE